MALTTYPLTIELYSSTGEPIRDALIEIRLTQPDVSVGEGNVSRERIEGTTDANGSAVFSLWPNSLGSNGSKYHIRARNSVTGQKILDVLVSMPAQECALRDLLIQDTIGGAPSSFAALLEQLGVIADRLDALDGGGVTKPATPTLSGITKTDTSISGVVTAVANATYRIYSSGALILEQSSPTFVLTQATHGIQPDTEYSLTASVVVDGIASNQSAPVLVTTDSTPVVTPDAPTVTLFGTPDYESGQVVVTGESGAAITVYVDGVQYATGTSGDTFTITGLTQSDSVAVTATQTVGGETSALSSAVTITTTAVPNVTHSVVDVTDTTIDLSFANLISGAAINVTVGGNTTTITGTSYQITGQTAESIVNISYTQTVGGQTSPSTAFGVTMDAATPVDPYPNSWLTDGLLASNGVLYASQPLAASN